jgi:membrane protein
LAPKKFAKDLYHAIQNDNVFNGAAALSFYLILAIFPAAIFLLSILPYLPIPNLQEAIMNLLAQALPKESAQMFSGIIENIVSEKNGGLLTFGFLFTLWSASSGIYSIMQQLNITYDVREGRPFWKIRGIALFLMVCFFVLIVGAFGLVIFGGWIQDRLAGVLGGGDLLFTLFAIIRWAIIAVALLLAFALMYYYGPDVEQDFKFVSPGAIIGVVLLALGSLAFRFYIEQFSNYNATYGSLGGVIILLLWLYLAGLVILLGSEINALIEHYHPEGKEKGEKVKSTSKRQEPVEA